MSHYTVGMLCKCYSKMDPELFAKLPSSTNAVESYNRFGKSQHPLPLKAAMMATYKEDMVKAFEVIARKKGLAVSYEDPSIATRAYRSAKQNKARNKRSIDMCDDPEGPPDTKRTFNPGMLGIIYVTTDPYIYTPSVHAIHRHMHK